MVTLSQLLALPHLGLKLIQSGPGDPVITWGSITELLKLSDYLEGGEIIMTTGLQLESDDAAWVDFVAGLSRARIAGIGFGVGINHDRVPDPLIRAASTYRVALFEIPLPVPFIAVSKAIAELLRTDELRATHTALQAQRRILDGARGEQDPADVLASIAQATGRQLALISSTDPTHPLASTGGFSHDTAAHTELVPLDADGSIHLAVSGSAPLTPEGSSVIAAGAMVLGLGLRNDSASERTERERWELLTERVLGGDLPIAAAEVLAPGLRIPSTIRAVVVQGDPEDLAEWRREPRRGVDRLIAPTEELPGGLARAWQIVPLVHEEAAAFRAANRGLDAVMGRPASPDDAHMSVRSAASRLHDLPGTMSLYAEPRVPCIIWADRDAPFLEAALSLNDSGGGTLPLSSSVLGPLSMRCGEGALTRPRVDPTAGEGPEHLSDADRTLLRSTLYEVFVSDGQRGPAAAALGIHRNTLRDRVARIERLTGRSLASAEDRAELWFALRTEDLG